MRQEPASERSFHIQNERPKNRYNRDSLAVEIRVIRQESGVP
jgi:hypothetical protein